MADYIVYFFPAVDTKPTELKPVDDGHAKTTSQLLPTEASCDPATPPVKPDNQCFERPSSAGTSSSDTASSGLSTSSKPNVVISSDSSLSSLTTSSEKVPQQNSESNRSSKVINKHFQFHSNCFHLCCLMTL